MTSNNPSQRARKLLLQGEGIGVDFKRSTDGVHADDFCAFANTADGGVLLIGVSEARDPYGVQIGSPTGCAVDDAAKLQITNKAQSCQPPVFIDIHTECDGDIRFLRIEIPPSTTRPHCTPKGVYLSRSGSRNVALLPPQLLAMFLEREAESFQNRFSDAASAITTKLAKTETLIAGMQGAIEKRVEDIADQLGWSDFNLDDTGDKIDRVEELIRDAIRRQKDAASRMRELLKAGSTHDPIPQRALDAAREGIRDAILKNEAMIRGSSTGDKLNLTTTGEIAEELDNADLQTVFEEVLSETLFKTPSEPQGPLNNDPDTAPPAASDPSRSRPSDTPADAPD